jgi:hypothetical protein
VLDQHYPDTFPYNPTFELRTSASGIAIISLFQVGGPGGDGGGEGERRQRRWRDGGIGRGDTRLFFGP